jgi:hypothetical protein
LDQFGQVYVDVEKDVLERQLEQEDSNSTSEAMGQCGSTECGRYLNDMGPS